MAHRRKTLSQNFLNRPATALRIVRAAAVGPDDLVLEPGPGTGALTRHLAERARRVTAYELDPVLAARLSRRLADQPRVRVVRGDFLRARPPREPFTVVGNIPYSRTSDIVRWCLRAPGLTSATLVTQWEYARGRTGGYGRWTLQTVASWPEFEWRLVGRVPRREFTPVPATDSAVLRLDRRPAPLLARADLARYREFITHGFSGVGGSVYATLAPRYRARRARAAFHRHGIDRALPCGLLMPAQWLALFEALHGPEAKSGCHPGGPRPR